MTQQERVLEAKNITKTFASKTGGERLTVLDDISVSIYKGAVNCVVGASGSGKSTLLHILGGLDHPDTGDIYWNEQQMYAMNEQELADFRNEKLGFIFQFHHLLPEFTALENVMMPALISGTAFDEAERRAKELLEKFDIAGRAEHRPAELSGGEQQRVALGRALINNPKLILADEPTGNLDEGNTKIVLDMLFGLRETENVTILIITHENEIARQTDKTYALQKGKLHPF